VQQPADGKEDTVDGEHLGGMFQQDIQIQSGFFAHVLHVMNDFRDEHQDDQYSVMRVGQKAIGGGNKEGQAQAQHILKAGKAFAETYGQCPFADLPVTLYVAVVVHG